MRRSIPTLYRRKAWLYLKADFDALNVALEESLPPESILSGGDVDCTWPLLLRSFMDTVNRFIPCKFVTCKKSLPPWITSSVRHAFHKRDRARRVAKQLNTPDVWASFRRLRNLAVSAVRKARKAFFSSLSIWLGGRNNFWRTYKSLSSNSTKVAPYLSNGSISA